MSDNKSEAGQGAAERRGRGRPSKGDQANTVNLTVRVPAELSKRLQARAADAGRSLGVVVRELLRAGMAPKPAEASGASGVDQSVESGGGPGSAQG